MKIVSVVQDSQSITHSTPSKLTFLGSIKKKISKRAVSFSLHLKLFSRGCFFSRILTMSTALTGKTCKVS